MNLFMKATPSFYAEELFNTVVQYDADNSEVVMTRQVQFRAGEAPVIDDPYFKMTLNQGRPL